MNARSTLFHIPSLLLVVLFLSLPAPVARARDAEPDYQQWLQVVTELKLPKSLLWSLDLQSRRMNAPLAAVKDANGKVIDYAPNSNTVLIIRPALGYQLAPWASAWVGYAFQPDYFDDPAVRAKKNVSEHRVFEQLSTSFNWGQWTLSTRTRVEQRVRTNGPGSSENDGGLSHWAHRVRQQVRAQYSVVKDKPWLVIAWDECFFHLNHTAYPTERGFDQNRAFVGLGYQATPQLRAELGYMNQYVQRYTDANQVNHVLNAGLNVKFDLSGAP